MNKNRLLKILGLLFIAACQSTPASPPGPGSSANPASATVGATSDLKLADVQSAIKAQSAGWIAGETTVSSQPRADRLQMLGVPLSSLNTDHLRVITDAVTPDFGIIPPLLDWRDHAGQNFVSPILDQGRCGSCVAFSTLGTFETQLNITAGDATSPWQLSPQYLFSCGGGSCNMGWNVGPAAQFLISTGTTDLSCMPYTSGPHGDDAQCSAACSDASSRVVKASGYSQPTTGGLSVTAVKNALLNGPVVATMTVYDDFMFYTGGVYKHVTGAVDGGHAVSIIGWSDTDSAWIVRNSWGTGWGDSGFFKIAWTDVSGVGEQTWALTVPAPGPYLALSGIRDATVLSGDAQAIAFDAKSITSPITWSLTTSKSSMAQGTSADGATASIDTTTVADGVYTLQAQAGSVKSEPHTVYVLNGSESGTISFASLTAGQTVSGESEFDIDVSAQPIPLTRIAWTVVNSAGTAVLSRGTTDTGSVMQLAWPTDQFPNGAYSINITGYAGTQSIGTVSRNVTVSN